MDAPNNLFRLCIAGDTKQVEEIFKFSNEFVCKDINYAFKLAARDGHLQIVKCLVENGADVCTDNNWALYYASLNEHFDIIKYLVENGADVNGSNGCILRCAVSTGNIEIIKFLIGKGSNIHENFFITCIPTIIYTPNIINIVKFLVGKGCDIHADDWFIKFCSFKEQFQIVRYIVDECNGSILDVSTKCLKYLSFCKKMEEKRKIRAQKIIYYWWIPICYSLTHPSKCGWRMAQRNVDEYKAMMTNL